MKKKYLLILFLLFLKQVAGQNPPLTNLSPPSPNAASLAKYADIPVSNYTGVPNISIPLMDLQSGKINLPVSASYHSSGIKVGEEASWIGLGWTLNAGGMITRQTRGLDDFKQQGGYIRTQLPPATAANQPDWSDPTKPPGNTANFDYYWGHYYSPIERRDLDPEPDIFYYNFLQYSGKLVFEKQFGEVVKAVSIDQNNLTFVYDITSKVWTVTDGDGWKYYLGSQSLNAVETTTSHNLSDVNPITPANDRIAHGDPDIFDSAWYLTKVVNPEGDQIDFVYETLGKTVSQLSRSEQISDWMDAKDVLNGQYEYKYKYVTRNARKRSYSASQQVINPVYLKKIIFSNGYVDFTTEDRTDLRSNVSTDPKAKRLKTLQLYNLKGTLVKQYDFNYSYFSSLPSGSGIPIMDNEERKVRLRLDSLKESANVNNGAKTVKNPPYVFSYNSTLLPEKTSYSIDYWGYNNAKNNSSIIDYAYRDFNLRDRINLITPSTNSLLQALVPFYEGIGSVNTFFTGANREVDSNAAQAAILEKIQYPTGAVVDFKYESNDYYSDKEVLYEDQPQTESAKITGNSAKTSEKVFTLDKLTMVQLSFEIYNLMGSPITDQMTADLMDQNGKVLISMQAWNGSHANKSVFNHYMTVFLPAGTYKIKVDNKTSLPVNMEVKVQYVKKNVTYKKAGAGLRVQSITTTDGAATVKKKTYSYTNSGKSTGLLISPYHFFYNEEILTNGFSGGYFSELIFQQINKYIVRCSESAVPFGNSAQGSVIGYNEVTVSDVDADATSNLGALGSKKYFYRNIKEIPVEAFIPGMPNIINLSNGQLLKEESWNNSGNIVSEKTVGYTLENTVKKVKGVKLYNNEDGSNTDIRFYDVFSEWWHPESTAETVYDIDGKNPITIVSSFKYQNAQHKNLTETKTKDSKGQVVTSVSLYPQDLASGIDETSSAVISSMVSSNVINPVLKTEIKVGNDVVKSQITNYAAYTHSSAAGSNTMFVPVNVKVLKKGSASDYEEALQFTVYDNNGHIVEQRKTNGVPVSYLWGYNAEYVIAKIENASYSSIPENLITAAKTASDSGAEATLLTALNNIRSAHELSGAKIITYTYIPLIGVSSITDEKGMTTYYEYDSFGRLSFIKDQDQNVLQKYCYGYKGQQVNCSLEDPFAEVFRSAPQSGTFTKGNCPAGAQGSGVPYSQSAGAASSTISQADADTKGLDLFNTQGQANADLKGVCIFGSASLSGSFTKNNCAAGGTGSSVSYSQAAGIATSSLSQADADAQGLALFNTNGQLNANSIGICTFSSGALSSTFTKNNCAAGGTGSSVSYSQGAGAVTSTVSQADADAQALAVFSANGQANANSNGGCTFISMALSASFTKNNCAAGGTGSSLSYSQGAGAVISTVSQADADAQALAVFNANGQANANANGFCSFASPALSGSFTKDNCAAGGTGSSVPYNQAAAAVISTLSQADADARGLALFNTNGQSNANINGNCTFNSPALSGSFTKNNCAVGGIGSAVSYSQAVGAAISALSQSDADAKGLALFNANGQSYANSAGTCNFSSAAINGVISKNDCALGGVGSEVNYSLPAGAITSTMSQADADSRAVNLFHSNGQANANANGTCTFSSVERSGSFVRNNCGTGTGSAVSYSQAAGAVTSTISQAHADSQGLVLFNTNGQAYANANGICTFSSPAESGTFIKGGCASGGEGSSVFYTQAAGAVVSTISQADADNLGHDKFMENGRKYAALMGVCTYSSTAREGRFIKNNCLQGEEGSIVNYNQPAGAATSTVSQAAADEAGLAKFNADGQAYANQWGTCSQFITYTPKWNYATKTLALLAVASTASHNGVTVRFNIRYRNGGDQIRLAEIYIAPGKTSNAISIRLETNESPVVEITAVERIR